MALQAGNLGLAELKGNWKMAEEFANIVNDISLMDINQAFVKYSNAISWTYYRFDAARKSELEAVLG